MRLRPRWMPTRGKPLYTYSIRATLSSRSSRTCSRNYSGLLPKCPPTCAGTPATPRVFSHAGRGLPYFSYARSAGVLQQERHMGGRAQPARPVRTTWAHAAHLRSGHLARGEGTRVPADPAFHPAGQRQFDRVDGRPLRWRSIGEPDLFPTLETTTDVRPHAD